MSTEFIVQRSAEQFSHGGTCTRETRNSIKRGTSSVRWMLPLLGFFAASQTIAAPLTFDFNTITLSGNYSNGLGAVGGNTAIGNYMNGVLTSGGYASSSVSVSGALATKTYNGEGHVIGDSLGTSNFGAHHAGDNDTFIINNNFGIGAPRADRFTLSFTNFKVYSLSFDWQIFPDATCAAWSWCSFNPSHSDWPDIELLVDGNPLPVWSALASSPGFGKDPQGFGVSPILNLNGAQTLTFVDWPAEIGIDNLNISGCVATVPNCLQKTITTVPEPSTLPLVALALTLGLFGYCTKRKAASVTQ